MDFQALHSLLPKHPQAWSTQETTLWLNYISLPHLIPKFRNASIDGSCIYLLDSDALKEELGIQSAIVRKKIMNWVTFGFKNYEQFMSSSMKMQQIKVCEKEPLQLKKSITQCIRETKPHPTHSLPSSYCNNDEHYLTLQQFEGSNLGFHIVKNEALTIGSHKNNQIMSLETSISEKHAIIGKREEGSGRYYIQDLGSKFGTYIKINQRMALKNGMILEIGSYQFAVSSIDSQRQSLKLKLTSYTENDSDSENIDSSNSGSIAKHDKNHNMTLHIDLQSKTKYTFGRRKQNDFQKDDKHMSGMHCKITFISGKFYIEDYGSTNGTWMRISPEFTISKQTELFNQTVVKLGTAISYICRINNSTGNKNKEEDGEMIDQNMCKFCKKLQNNCLFLPCSHNISCMECCQKVGQFCPECKFEIQQKIKIHK